MLALGWLGGAASLGAWVAVRRRRGTRQAAAPVALLPAPSFPTVDLKADVFSIPDRAG